MTDKQTDSFVKRTIDIRKETKFSVVDLLSVVSIIGILAAMVVAICF